MVFNSWNFALFFAAFFALYRLPFPWVVKKVFLLLGSYLFYAAWNPPFVLLLILSAVVDYWLAHAIARSSSVLRKRLLLLISLILNLGLLGIFKYGNFIIENSQWLLDLLHVPYLVPKLNIILPLGISFYTFETISYLIDVYRGKLKPTDSFLDYAIFLTFFPHLVAGPIVRASDFLPQCQKKHQASSAQIGWGMILLVVGLFEKVLLADYCLAKVADVVFAGSSEAGAIDAWIGALAFSGQIFFDFAGYSTCAIGTALCLGFVLVDNFHFPYAAVGFSDFWQRWHISLSSWLRDYLYIPLGGNRLGPMRTQFNLMLTMLLGGLWHGASWQFVVWGGLHGLFLVVERWLRRGREPRQVHGLHGFGLALLTFLCVTFAWVFFRATTFTSAFELSKVMLWPFGSTVITLVNASKIAVVLVLIAGLLLSHWWLRHSSLEALAAKLPWWVVALALLVMILVLSLIPGDDRAFIYFQF
jgi:alginate O-acetyltransferase complex protein AlgI